MNININWSGPFNLKETYELVEDSSDYGVYQIYGSHTVYGSHVLLYIGKAVQQTFGVRIKQESWEGNKDSNNIQVYVGRVDKQDVTSAKQWNKLIDIAERMLLFACAPARNSKSITTLPVEYVNVHVLNWGHYRDVLPEVSGKRWATDHEPKNNKL